MISSFENKHPFIHESAFVHPDATLIGDAHVGAQSSIWPGTILRADMGRIEIGECTSVQDGTIVHLTYDLSHTKIGNRVTVGHRVILHGCTVEDNCLIGMGAILLDNCVIGKGSLIGAGALVTAGTIIPPNSLVLGSPAQVKRNVSEKETKMIQDGWRIYVDYTQRFLSQAAR